MCERECIAAGVMGTREKVFGASECFTAVVFGPTGATGRYMVKELAESAKCTQINALTRREIKDFDATWPNISKEGRKKVNVQVVDYENLKGTIGSACKEADVAFCCLGTTQSEAGGKTQFTKVDLDYVANSAHQSKEGNVGHFALVTAAGVFRSCPRFISNYIWTKARAEEAVLKLQFPLGTSIWHPGMLEREEMTRSGTETWAKKLGAKGLPVADLAKAMRVYVEQLASGLRQPKSEEILKDKDIKHLASQN